MTYVCADVHGEYELFLELLSKIGFSDGDVMYICGDVVEKGPQSVKLLKYVLSQKNIVMIMGNHEYEFVKYYHALMSQAGDNTDYDEMLRTLQKYFSDGNLLDWDTIDQIENLPFYFESDKFICVHSGIPVLPNNTLEDLSRVLPEYLVYDRRFKEPTVLPKTDKCVFFGHTPTPYVINEPRIIKYATVSNPREVTDYCKMHLDLGTWIYGVMGCICVETLEEFYVAKR